MKELIRPTPHEFHAKLSKLGISQNAVAYSLGVSQPYLCMMLRGFREFNPVFEDEIAELLYHEELRRRKK